jgi:hypothetical protein
MSYVQTFTLYPEAGSYFVLNDIFRCECAEKRWFVAKLTYFASGIPCCMSAEL